ncbi:hypothetical protein P280DRAFT_473125 [Massarina eburnea CBS 473.64]|uniref:Uncharacterized protein n=1 Tax=Massarina eburnea CBS 473.64 TaxID=1395130 RepID=A0A6A6RM25_9PLEO|nr:hypothetical protein P280DRAFT_473125 [Massarina eburnea CBS 473.64]
MPGFRPASFFTALYAHSSTLQSLHIGFFTHELHDVPAPAPGTRWPEPLNLDIDARAAHGDNGSAVDEMLKGASGEASRLESLRFEWPKCDLGGCGFGGIGWDYALPKLHKLKISSNESPHSIAQWFSKEAAQPIHELVISVIPNFTGILKDLVNVAGDRLEALESLEVVENVSAWRPKKAQTDSDRDSESDGEEKTGRVKRRLWRRRRQAQRKRKIKTAQSTSSKLYCHTSSA